ncbi:MAG: MFS transporter [Candidatus Levybacteria bacterium]|nr:MFS transporter [Candidatus Levybacteria bacterium]
MISHRNITLLKWFNFFIDFRLYAPIAIIYFSQITGSFALGMSVFSITMLASAFFELPTGVFSDKIGRKNTVILGAVSAVLFSIFYAIGGSFWILAIGAIFEGLSRAFYSGNNDALLHDTLSELGQEEYYDEHLGKVSATSQMALGIASILGGFLAVWSFAFIMWFSVFPQLLCFILAFFLIEPKIHKVGSGNIYAHLSEAYKNFITNKKLRLLSLSSILGYGFGEASYQFVPAFYNTLWPVWAIGIAKTMSNMLATLSFHFSGKLIRRFDGFKVMLVDNIINRIIGITATAFPTVLSPFFMSTTSAFYGVVTVARNALMQKEFTNEQRATMGSLNALAGSIFFGIVAFILGFTADQLSPAKAILILQIFQIGNLFIYWKLFKHNASS